MATTMIHTRLPEDLKLKAEKIFKKLGLSPSEAIRMFYAQVVNHKGIPFESRIPNAATKRALDNFKKGDRKNFKSFKSVEELFADLES